MKFGILGTASIARKNAIAIHCNPTTTLCGVASRALETAEAYVATLGIPDVRAYGTYQALLDDAQIDAVYIPLPTVLHLEWVLKACRAGKHVLVEKPVAVCVADLDTMLQACKENNVLLMDGTMFVHHFRLRKLQALLASPRLSQQVQRMNSCFCFRADDAFFANNIRGNGGLDPLGALGDLGWYCTRMSLIAFAGTRPVSVVAECRKWSPDGVVPYDLSATIYFDEAKDRFCHFQCSFVASFQQTFSISTRATLPQGLDKVITCDDFCIPRSALSAHFKIETLAPNPLDDVAGCVVSSIEHLRGDDCAQEQQMFGAFAELIRSRGGSAESQARVQELQQGMQTTQMLMNCMLDSARQNKEIRC
mgnify:CR=1 FL=1